MKSNLTLVFTAALLLTTQPVFAGSWAEEIIEWFTDLFTSDPPVEKRSLTPAQLDSLRATPLGLQVVEIPDADTLAINGSWPLESLTVATDLERHNRLLRETIVLTNPSGILPFEDVPAVRVIYRQDQKPRYFLQVLGRFTDVQAIPFDEVLPEALRFAVDIPTIILVDDPANGARFNADWYTKLFDRTTDKSICLHFGDPAVLTGLPKDWTLINSPLRSKESEAFLAQALFGAQTLDGRLESYTTAFPVGTGYRLDATRGGFRMPELLGIDRTKFDYVDYQINRGIRYRAMPGAQLLVMKDGHVVYEKAYGHHTYRQQAVTPGDLYDVASITKAAATSLAVMKLYDAGKIDLEAQVRDYLPEFKRRQIGRYRIEQLLTHHTGLQPELPLYGLIGKQFVSDTEHDDFSLPIGQERWLDERVPEMVRKALRGKIAFTRRAVYKYSDINYYLLQLITEAIAEEPMEELLEREVYAPLGLGKLTFRPAERFPKERLVPTVRDPWMRGGLLRGYVHDEGAALLGGVAGHAGLFSNAYDLARLFQVLNAGGTYAGEEIFSLETVALFTSRSRYNYRALGFDRLAGGWSNVVSAGASMNTIGHLGFSGTSVWSDPENDLVFVLLTNRVHPNPTNEKFMKMRIRGRVHAGVYRALNTWEMVN
ncbi:MAG: serine hydrolase [Bacteroidota bacterium]